MLNDAEFQRLLDLFDLSWEGYRRVRKGVKKRLRRRLEALGLRRVEDYLRALESDPGLRAECRLLLTVSVSRFFRDRDLWSCLTREILPLLDRGPAVRAWSAGCARGEEAYSLRIVHEQRRRQAGSGPALEILATDLNPAYLDRARAGVFQGSSLREVPEEVRAEYFRKVPGRKLWQVAESLKPGLVWREHDLLAGPSPGLFDLILMRNSVLTYCGRSLQEAGLRTALASLGEGGFLVIGRREALPPGDWGLRPWPGSVFIFRKAPWPV